MDFNRWSQSEIYCIKGVYIRHHFQHNDHNRACMNTTSFRELLASSEIHSLKPMNSQVSEHVHMCNGQKTLYTMYKQECNIKATTQSRIIPYPGTNAESVLIVLDPKPICQKVFNNSQVHTVQVIHNKTFCHVEGTMPHEY